MSKTARFEMPDGRIAKFEVPDDYTPEQAQAEIKQFVSQQQGSGQPAEEQQERPRITGGRGLHGQIVQQQRFDEKQASQLDERLRAGEITAQDLTPEQISAVQKQRIAQIPEIAGRFKDLSENLGFTQALAGMTAFDPDEFGKILQSADPNIGIVSTPEGERIAVNNETGAAFSINKLGPSMVDAFQLGGAFAAFTPAGKAPSLIGQVAGGMGTQALIETGQAAAGGDFDPADVALAGAAPVVVRKGSQLAKSGVRQLRGRSAGAVQYIDEQLTGAAQSKSPQPSTLQAKAADRIEQPIRETARKAEIRQALKEGSRESAGWKLNPRGQVVRDKVARETVSQGFDPRTVATIKVGSAADRQAMLKMLDVAEESMKSATSRVRNRPQQVIGDTVMNRFKVIAKANKEAGKEIGRIASEKLKGKSVDISGAIDDFADDLDNLGIQMGDDGLDFAGSQIEGNRATTAIKRVFNRLKTEDDGLSLHKLKQYIDNQINWDKSPDRPLDKQAVNVLKKLRNGINERLQNESADYAAANAKFRETIKPINDLSDVMGRRFDPESERVADVVGQELRKVLSNYGVRNDMIMAIDQLDDVARKYGGQFADDPLHQVVFYSDLERVLGSFADNSLQGTAEKALGVGLDVATGSPVNTGANLIKSGLGKALGKSEEKAISSMRRLLSE